MGMIVALVIRIAGKSHVGRIPFTSFCFFHQIFPNRGVENRFSIVYPNEWHIHTMRRLFIKFKIDFFLFHAEVALYFVWLANDLLCWLIYLLELGCYSRMSKACFRYIFLISFEAILAPDWIWFNLGFWALCVWSFSAIIPIHFLTILFWILQSSDISTVAI